MSNKNICYNRLVTKIVKKIALLFQVGRVLRLIEIN